MYVMCSLLAPIVHTNEISQGLRGIAAVFVMFSHLSLCFIRYAVLPAKSEMGPSRWMQRPYLRLVTQGPAWVACFFILSGFVNALKPVKLARSGQVETALSNLAVSSFRRTFRLFLPATAATLISWFLCQLGAYETARNSDAYWVQITSPPSSYSWGVAVEDLIAAIRSTWTYNPDNPYDQPQWALLYLLQGSMFVFCALLVTVNLTPRWRVLTMVVCWFWSWNWGIRIGDRRSAPTTHDDGGSSTDFTATAMVGVNMFAGILLAELNYSDFPARLARRSPLLFPPLLAFSLLLMSFPGECAHWAPWSLTLLKWFSYLAPEDAESSRFWPTIGAQLLCLTIVCSPHLRRALNHPILLWLGKISFPLYLLHGTFMRTILSWLLFAGQDLAAMEGEKPPPPSGYENDIARSDTVVIMRHPLPSPIVFVAVLPVFFVILGVACHYWTENVEPRFGKITKRAEDIMFGKESQPPALPIRKD